MILQAAPCRQPVVTQIHNPNPPPPPKGPFTIVTLNMAEETDYRVIVSEFNRNEALAHADIILLQEVLHSTGPEGVLQNLSRELGVQIAFSSATEPRPDGQIDGMALLSRHPMEDASAFSLAAFNLNVRSRCRHALTAVIASPRGPVRVFDVHLDTRINAANRVAQLQPVVDAAKKFSGPVVIGGDFNTNPNFWIQHLIPIPFLHDQHTPVHQMLTREGFSTPLDGSIATHDMLGLRLDWIYLRHLTGSKWGVEEIDFSDHRAVWLQLAP